jgi:hypothetical protein
MTELLKLLEIIKSKITDDTDLMWTSYNSAEKLIAKIDLNSKLLENSNNQQSLEFFQHLFAPTGTFQEISMQNGWSDEYLKLASEFDTLYEKLINKNL